MKSCRAANQLISDCLNLKDALSFQQSSKASSRNIHSVAQIQEALKLLVKQHDSAPRKYQELKKYDVEESERMRNLPTVPYTLLKSLILYLFVGCAVYAAAPWVFKCLSFLDNLMMPLNRLTTSDAQRPTMSEIFKECAENKVVADLLGMVMGFIAALADGELLNVIAAERDYSEVKPFFLALYKWEAKFEQAMMREINLEKHSLFSPTTRPVLSLYKEKLQRVIAEQAMNLKDDDNAVRQLSSLANFVKKNEITAKNSDDVIRQIRQNVDAIRMPVEGEKRAPYIICIEQFNGMIRVLNHAVQPPPVRRQGLLRWADRPW
jgi:hypothetical protein